LTASVRRPVRAYLGLGSNVGDRVAHLQRAIDGMRAAGLDVVAVSNVYETDPVGGPEQADFANAVVAVETTLDARALLSVAQRLEVEAGRERTVRWGPRSLDVDVLLVGEDIVEEADLVVPHPRLGQRSFVLIPLADLDAELAARIGDVPLSTEGVRLTERRLV